MTTYRPYDPFEAMRNGEVTFTTTIVSPHMSAETRSKLEKKSEIMALSLLLLIGSFIAAIFKLHLIYAILFGGFVLALVTYLVATAIIHRKIEAYSEIGLITWQSDRLIVEFDKNQQQLVILFETIQQIKSKTGIPYQLLSKSYNRKQDYLSFTVDFLLNEGALITTELNYMSNCHISDPYKIGRPDLLTEKLLKFAFKDYIILDVLAIDRN